jgi:membrane-bound lytic murein transglycosylase B
MKRTVIGLLTALAIGSATANDHPGVDAFVQRAVSEYGLDANMVSGLLDEAVYKQSIVDAISRPAESKPWHEYRQIFLTGKRIAAGARFWNENRELIDRVAARFGVDPQIIVAIIGVETLYGRITGSYRVLDALTTLGFYYPKELGNDRSGFFAGELLQFMLLGQEENLPLDRVTGSYAGAMGMGQFIPSSYREYAVDFDGNGHRDLWRSTPDVVASVANYLHRHGWRPGEPIAARASADAGADPAAVAKRNFRPARSIGEIAGRGYRADGDLGTDRLAAVLRLEQEDGYEYWLTFDNFYVITRYNRSPLYAMAVLQLSEAILGEMD